MPATLENSAVATGLEKVSFIPVPKKGKAKECPNYLHNCADFTCHQGHAQNPPSQASTVCEPRTFKCTSGLEKAEEPEIKLPTFAGSLKNQESSRKTSISALLTMPKPLTVWITIHCGKF